LLVLLGTTAVVGWFGSEPAAALGRDAAVNANRTADSARKVYQALSDADVSASAVFLVPANSPEGNDLKIAYDRAVQRVDRALVDAVRYIGSDATRSARISVVARRLEAYRRVIADADALAGDNDPLNDILAAAFAREASAYLRERLLPVAYRLWTAETDRLRHARTAGRWWLLASVALPVLDLAALGWLQWWLWRRTRRRVNLWLVGATALTVAALVGLGGLWSHWAAADRQLGRAEHALAAQTNVQEELRRSLEARAKEYLRLSASLDPAKHEKEFREAAGCPDKALSVELCKAYDSARAQEQTGEPGSHDQAIAAVLPDGPVGEAFAALNNRLSAESSRHAALAHAALDRAPKAPAPVGRSVAALTVLAGLAGLAGLRARLAEYR
jgi:hypothetical protein